MNIEDMNEGVRLLGQRMETNPEEFASAGRWRNMYEWLSGMVEMDHSFLLPEEVNYLQTKFREARRHNFTSDVLRALTRSEDPPQMKETVGYGQPQKQVLTRKTNTIQGNLTTANAITGVNVANGLNLNIPSIDAHIDARIKKMQDEMQQEMIKRQWNAMVTNKP